MILLLCCIVPGQSVDCSDVNGLWLLPRGRETDVFQAEALFTCICSVVLGITLPDKRLKYAQLGRAYRMCSALQGFALHLSRHKQRCPFCDGERKDCTCVIAISGQSGNFQALDPRDTPIAGRWVAALPVQGRHRGVTRGALFGLFWRLNAIKVTLLLFRAQLGVTKWERNWLKYVVRCWNEIAEPVANMWEARDLLYQCVTLYSNSEYLGETRIGLEKRGTTHIRHARLRSMCAKMKFYRWLKALGSHLATFLPIRSWVGEVRPTKKQRLAGEAFEIFTRQSNQNEVGRSRGSERQNVYGERMLLGRDKRGRQLMRFRVTHAPRDTLVMHQTVEEPPAAPVQQMKMLPIVMRMGRRPWKLLPGFSDMRVVKTVRRFGQRKLGRLVGFAQMVLDTSSRSIFHVNLKLVLAGMRKICTMAVNIRSSLLALSGAETKLLQCLRRWVARWGRQGFFIILRATITVASSPSILSILDSTEKWASVPVDMST